MSADPGEWCAGIVSHGGYDDIEACLRGLARQSCPPTRIQIYDTGVNPERAESLAERHPEVAFEVGANLGYAGGANRIVERLTERPGDPAFVLVMNPDVVLDPDFARQLLATTADREDAALFSGKLLRPGRELIDSAGIRFPRHRRPRDRGSEEPDDGRYGETEEVEAVSGAAIFIRVAAIPELSIEGELFDEDFFVYHEDTDLCWRAREIGWKVVYAPAAVAVHGRAWRREKRFEMPVPVRRHSFKNHYLQIVKNTRLSGFLLELPWLAVWEVLRAGFVLVRDRRLLGGYRDAAVLLPGAFRKRRAIRARARARRDAQRHLGASPPLG